MKAKSKLQYPDIEWSADNFEAHFTKMNRLAKSFKEIEGKLTPGTSTNILSSLVGHGLKAMRTVGADDDGDRS